MDWFPLFNSLRIAALSCVLVFFGGIAAAYYAARLPRLAKGVLDALLTLPMVLPPTVVGYLLLLVFGNRRPVGALLARWGLPFVMTWYGGVLAAAVVAFPLMYRTARGAFEAFDETLDQAGQTLGLSGTFLFWRVRMPACRQGILAGVVLAFARRWASTAPPACSSATRRGAPPRFPPRSTSCGEPATTRGRCSGWG